MADISQFIRKYQKFNSTFKITSFDSDNNEYLCMDESQEVINYDKIIEEKYPDSNIRPKTFDSIYIDNTNIYLVEFKNEKKPNKKEIEDKLLAGKKELDRLFKDLNISKKEYQFIFCLAYNKYKPKHERFKQGLFKSTTFEFLHQHKNNGIIDDIYTEDVNFFTKQFKKQLQKELAC